MGPAATPVPGWTRLVSWRTAIAGALLAITGSVVFIALTGGHVSAWRVTAVVLLAVAASMVVLVIVNVVIQLAGIDREASEISGHLAHDPDQQRLLTRWLGRARWARFVGGLSGIVIWVLGTRTKGDLLLLGTGGIALGAILAELHHIRPRKGRRTARLDVRSVGNYMIRDDARRMVGVGVAALAVVIAGIVASEANAASWWGLAAVAALGAARIAQERVATRPRPAVSENLTRADDLARELAIGRGLARPATFFALALVARGCYSLTPTIGGYGTLLGGAAWLYALYLWWQNRRLGLDFLMTEQRDPVLP